MKQVKNIASKNYAGKRNKLNLGLMAAGAFFSTLAVISSVAQATDLQIYAAPTAGKKTIVMMLDTSGSMAEYDNDGCYYYSYWGRYYYGRGSEPATVTAPYPRDYCLNASNQKSYSRLTRLKDGMFAFLNSSDSSLNEVKVGLGNYSAGGDGKSGQILVPAEKLGIAGSAQRTNLKNAIKDLTAVTITPTAHAYAEAAAYLMGTSTIKTNLQMYFVRTSDSKYKTCGTWGADKKCVSSGWSSWSNYSFNVSKTTKREAGTLSGSPGYYYYANETNTDSGFSKSDTSTQNDDKTAYLSPLPAVEDRQSCDGQGVYILSDGAANGTSEYRSKSLISNALDSFGSGFTCDGGAGGLPEASDGGRNGPGGWRCMGELAKKLYNKAQNPAGVSIQTAFVGFGSDMSNLSEPFVANACKLSSRTQADRTSDDACSTGKATYGIPSPGFGNGGFFIANDSAEVTRSVIQFIDNIGKNPIDPLSTGAVSIPVDALNPHTYQPYGYLRALEPKPGTQNIIWMGNLKKYAVSSGALKSKDSSQWVFDTEGAFTKGTQDYWNTTSQTDDAGVNIGGVISNLVLPTEASPKGYRPIFTDISSVSSAGVITGSSTGNDLFFVSRSAVDSATLLKNFKNDSVLTNLAVDIKLKLLNYFGYPVALSPAVMPDTLTAPKDATSAMGASIHSFPVQMTYAGELDANGDLKSTRKQSVLYGSMEGALRAVDASTGTEQMVFVPSEILSDTTASNALVKGVSDVNGVTAGIGGAWIVDADYKVVSASDDTTSVEASKMNVYGGMRMGGKSYYGLNMLTPASPKFLFKITGGTGGYSRMGQTWSKPVLANIRINNKITRVMIVGGGYDACYENPRFVLGTANTEEFKIKNAAGVVTDSCKKNQAIGNAVYIINANTGALIWWASNSGADTNIASMKHSIVSRISTLDRDGDGLVDNLYFGDLGGQVFRIDLNNAVGASSLGVRAVRIADLATKTDGAAITNGDQPRFYQPPTLTVHDEGKNTFLVIGVASGDRSTPLDVSPEIGREKIKPFTALTGRLTNKVYGIIDRDIADVDLMKSTMVLKSENIKLNQMINNPQTNTTKKIANLFFPYSSIATWQGHGWYRSLSSGPNGVEIQTAKMTNARGEEVTTTRTPGGLKAFEEEPAAITGRLLVPVYDPQGTGIVDRSNPCQPRVIGETHVQQFCLPYGACLNDDGYVNADKEQSTGFQMLNGRNQNVLGAGIRGLSMGPADANGATPEKGSSCGALTILGLQSGKGRWECSKILNPTRWYEKYVEAKNN